MVKILWLIYSRRNNHGDGSDTKQGFDLDQALCSEAANLVEQSAMGIQSGSGLALFLDDSSPKLAERFNDFGTLVLKINALKE